MKILPIGIQSFTKLRDKNCVYVDKTELIHQLLMGSGTYFFARPRRFGKSMTLATLKAIYQGKKEYFTDLWIADKWDWTKRNPIIHLKFASILYGQFGIESAISKALQKIAKENEVILEETDYVAMFQELIDKLYEKEGKVVILIDEYDKPIIDFLDKAQRPIAEENRAALRAFYSIIKDADDYIEFFFMTGVSKFSQTGIFSHLNHLEDITLREEYVNLVGYTPTEVQTYFGDRIDYAYEKFTELCTKEEFLNAIRQWYNGYSWDAVQTVYNPYSILNFVSKRVFGNHWFTTGTPTMLIKMMREQERFVFNNLVTSSELLDSYDLENLDLRTILFQSGYLTVKKRDLQTGEYTLDYPNREVEQSMNNYMLAELLDQPYTVTAAPIFNIQTAFLENNVEKVVKIIHAALKDVPYALLRGKKEDFYHTVVHIYFRYLGLLMESELMTSDGRMDVVVKTSTHIYVIEFKIDESAAEAMKQIKTKDYAAKFGLDNKKIVLIGINFNSEKKGVGEWLMEDYN